MTEKKPRKKKEIVETAAAVSGEVVEVQPEPQPEQQEDPGVKAFEVLRQLLKDKNTASVVTKAIAEFQIRSYHAYKQRTGKRRLNEKETFIVISLGAANFVNHIRG